MSDQIPPIQKFREILGHCEQLRTNPAFRWFMEECVAHPMRLELETVLNLKKTQEEANTARHVYAALDQVAKALESQRRSAQQYIDSERKT